MNERIRELFKRAGGKTSARNLASNPVQVVETHELWDDRIEKFAELLVKDFYNMCDQAWTHNEKEHSKNDISPAEKLIYAGAMAQCQKMKENIKERFGIEP